MTWKPISDETPSRIVLEGKNAETGEIFNFVVIYESSVYVDGTGPHYELVRRDPAGGWRTVHHEGGGHNSGYPITCTPTHWDHLQPVRPQGAIVIEAGTLRDAVIDVVTERERQITQEGYTPEHDDRHVLGQLRDGAIAYALADRRCTRDAEALINFWPFDDEPKHKGYRRNLVIAAAMLIAEIERIDRSKARE